jgi:membrane-associated phospholipid phosphatase
MIAQYTVRSVVIRWAAWVFFALTVVSTLYVGWHYIADDIGGVIIAFLAVWLGGIATGQRFDHRMRHSHPTTSTAEVPVEPEDDEDSIPAKL